MNFKPKQILCIFESSLLYCPSIDLELFGTHIKRKPFTKVAWRLYLTKTGDDEATSITKLEESLLPRFWHRILDTVLYMYLQVEAGRKTKYHPAHPETNPYMNQDHIPSPETNPYMNHS